MAEPEEIAVRVGQLLAPGPLEGLQVLVTAGGTREPVDSVRFVGNRSSGRWASPSPRRPAARRRGDTAGGQPRVPASPRVRTIETPTAEATLEAALELEDVDIALLAAAVADYRPAEALATKRPKSAAAWTLELEPTADIALALGDRKQPGQVLVAFGAEHGEEGLERKRRMLTDKNADLVVYNDVSRGDIGFDSPDNEVVIVWPQGERRVPKAAKREIAAAILDEVESLLGRDQ